MARRDPHQCRWRFLRTARRGVLAAGVKPTAWWSRPRSFDHTFVFVVSTNPNPNEVFSIVNRKRPVIDSDSDRPEFANFLEMKRWV